MWRSHWNSAAIWRLEGLSKAAARRINRHRNAKAWGVEPARTKPSSWARWASERVTVSANGKGIGDILDAAALSGSPRRDPFHLINHPTCPDHWDLADNLRNGHLVRSGAVRARVSSTVWFSDDEIEATKEVLARVNGGFQKSVPSENHLTIHWTFPDPEGRFREGSHRFEPLNGPFLAALSQNGQHHATRRMRRLMNRRIFAGKPAKDGSDEYSSCIASRRNS